MRLQRCVLIYMFFQKENEIAEMCIHFMVFLQEEN